jgi:serine/threonine protein kinase
VGELDVVKIADFGLAKILQGGRLMVDRESQFPIKWTAPEAATKKEYTTKSDVWSFGILLYELVTHGSNPYPGMSNNEALQAVLNGYRMPKVNDFKCLLIMIMMRSFVAKRLS